MKEENLIFSKELIRVTILKKVLARFRRMHPVAHYAMALGAITMLCFYITALFALIIAPYVDYLNAITVHRGCLEAAPASLAAGVCAGLVGDLIMARHGGKDSREDEDDT